MLRKNPAQNIFRTVNSSFSDLPMSEGPFHTWSECVRARVCVCVRERERESDSERVRMCYSKARKGRRERELR